MDKIDGDKKHCDSFLHIWEKEAKQQHKLRRRTKGIDRATN